MARIDLLRVLLVRAQARRVLLDAGEFETAGEALAPLYAWAMQRGLVRRYGEGNIKAVIEAPFITAPRTG